MARIYDENDPGVQHEVLCRDSHYHVVEGTCEYRALHYGDFSGTIRLKAVTKKGEVKQEMDIPVEALLEFVGLYIKKQRDEKHKRDSGRNTIDRIINEL